MHKYMLPAIQMPEINCVSVCHVFNDAHHVMAVVVDGLSAAQQSSGCGVAAFFFRSLFFFRAGPALAGTTAFGTRRFRGAIFEIDVHNVFFRSLRVLHSW